MKKSLKRRKSPLKLPTKFTPDPFDTPQFPDGGDTYAHKYNPDVYQPVVVGGKKGFTTKSGASSFIPDENAYNHYQDSIRTTLPSNSGKPLTAPQDSLNQEIQGPPRDPSGLVNDSGSHTFRNGGTIYKRGGKIRKYASGGLSNAQQQTEWTDAGAGATSGALTGATFGASAAGATLGLSVPVGAAIGGLVGGVGGFLKGHNQAEQQNAQQAQLAQASKVAPVAQNNDPMNYFAQGGDTEPNIIEVQGNELEVKDGKILKDFKKQPTHEKGGYQYEAKPNRVIVSTPWRTRYQEGDAITRKTIEKNLVNDQAKREAQEQQDVASDLDTTSKVFDKGGAYYTEKFGKGGSVHIKPKFRSVFKKAADRVGMESDEYANHVLNSKLQDSAREGEPAIKGYDMQGGDPMEYSHGGVVQDEYGQKVLRAKLRGASTEPEMTDMYDGTAQFNKGGSIKFHDKVGKNPSNSLGIRSSDTKYLGLRKNFKIGGLTETEFQVAAKYGIGGVYKQGGNVAPNYTSNQWTPTKEYLHGSYNMGKNESFYPSYSDGGLSYMEAGTKGAPWFAMGGITEKYREHILNNGFGGGSYSKGGKIHINPANKGKFNATKKATGKSTEELTHSSNPVTKKRAVFAQNASHWKHEQGGLTIPYESGKDYDLSESQIEELKKQGYKIKIH